MAIPRDVQRFEILLYLSLLIDCLSVVFFGLAPDGENLADRPSASLFTACFIAALAFLVWLAARRRKNWARWTVFAFFMLSLVLYAGAFNELAFGFRDFVDVVSFAITAFGFYFSFTAEARRWFTT